MKTITMISFGAVTLVASAIWAMPQGSLIQQVQTKYVPTVMDASGIKVATPGTILVVQLDGVMVASKSKLSGLYYNEFKNGVIGPDGNLVKIGLNHRAFNPHALAVGDKVYLLKVDTSATSITFQVQSCGTCDPKAVDPSHHPAQAEVAFKFVRGGLQGTDFNQVKQVIEKVFMLPEDVPPATAQGSPPTTATDQLVQQGDNQPAQQVTAAQTDQPKFTDDPIPPPPPPDPPSVKEGMTIEEVTHLVGSPESTFDKGTDVVNGAKVSTVVYVYKALNLKVTFRNGKVLTVD
jgi:hypothetical protein